MNWYNNDIRIYLRDTKWPLGYVPTIKSEPQGLVLVLSKSELASLNPSQADLAQLELVMSQAVQWIRTQGVPCTIRVV